MLEPAREAAASRGETTYQGNPCKRGHDGKRFTLTGGCCACDREAQATRRDQLRKRLAEARARIRP